MSFLRKKCKIRKKTTKPVTKKSDIELVDLVKDGDSESFLEICRRYENIFYKICQRYNAALSFSGVNPQDIYDEKTCLIYHCITSYNPEKNTKLSTHIGNYSRYLCLNSISKRRFILPSSDLEIQKYIEDSQITHDYITNNSKLQDNFKYILNLLEQLQDPRITEIFNLRYLGAKRMIWLDIAKKMSISTQTAINLHNKGLELLKRKIVSKQISDII
jgi:hypothetical protein